MSTILSTSLHVYMVKFQQSSEKFIVNRKGMQDLLRDKPHKTNYLEYIKIFDPVKASFKALNKSILSSQTNFYTELHENLITRKFIKE